jgi:beta-phosphoglucomutase-like phosphatase (HAD superfamily)
MKKLPIDLPLKTMTTKVSVGAYERVRLLAKQHGVRVSDALSACILHMPEDKLAQVLAEQKATLDALPKHVKGLMQVIDKLDDEQKALIQDALNKS